MAAGTLGAEAACEPQRTLGVSRTVEIDTQSGPRFGHQQYPDIDFLQDGEVVLTFDDGPSRAYTRPILDALDQQCTKATFFMVGRMALSDPETTREVARRGHTVGTHTYSHANLKKMTPLKARAEIELGFSAVQAALGAPIAPFFRFPYLADPQSMIGHLQTRQVGIFSIEVDGYDYRTRDPATVQRTILNQLAQKRKGIILFHDIQVSTSRAMPNLLAALKANGYRVVHMVPKGQAQTLAEFDRQVQGEAARRKIATTTQPLADRAMTWQLQTRVAPEPYSSSPRVVPSQPTVAPVPQSTPAQAPAPVAADLPWRAPLRGRIDEDWRARVFRE
jgi:peptidoglycan/xylan/chitin deacetylase (PgdA/CDA1 family)